MHAYCIWGTMLEVTPEGYPDDQNPLSARSSAPSCACQPFSPQAALTDHSYSYSPLHRRGSNSGEGRLSRPRDGALDRDAVIGQDAGAWVWGGAGWLGAGRTGYEYMQLLTIQAEPLHRRCVCCSMSANPLKVEPNSFPFKCGPDLVMPPPF